MYLRQSTVSQEVLLGPFIDETDGKTAETGLTIANTDIKLWKSGGTSETNKNSGGATHIAAGRYYTVLDSTDTDTVGLFELNVHVSGALPVRRSFYVLEEVVYDSIFASGSTGPLSASEIRSSIGLATANLDTQLADIPTVAEFNARTLPSGSYNSGASGSGDWTTTEKSQIRYVLGVDGTQTIPVASPSGLFRSNIIQVNGVAASGTGTVSVSATEIRSAIGLSSANLDTQLGDVPTVTEFNARTLASGEYALQSEVDKIVKTGESRTISRSGKTSVTFTETRV